MTTRLLQRQILPLDRDTDVYSLYVDPDAAVLDADKYDVGGNRNARAVNAANLRQSIATGASIHPEQIEGRHALRIPQGSKLSFGTYFNAFPASYWRRWTVVTDVTLTVTLEGRGATVIVYKSMANGRSQRVDSASTDDRDSGTFAFDLTLVPFADGGWYWYDVVAGDTDVVVRSAEWSAEVPEDRAEHGTVAVGITTMNRPDFCAKLLTQIGAYDDLRPYLDEVFVALGDGPVERQRDLRREAEDRRGVQLHPDPAVRRHGRLGGGHAVEELEGLVAAGQRRADRDHDAREPVEVAHAVLEADDPGQRGDLDGRLGVEAGVAAVVDDQRQAAALGDGPDVAHQPGGGGLHQVGRQQQQAVRARLPGGPGELEGQWQRPAGARVHRDASGGHLDGGADHPRVLLRSQGVELARAAGREDPAGARVQACPQVLGQDIGIHRSGRGERCHRKEQHALEHRHLITSSLRGPDRRLSANSSTYVDAFHM